MSFRIVRTIATRELLDTFRDKRTLLMMIGIPLLLYPALLIFTMQIGLRQLDKLDTQPARVAVTGPGAEVLRPWFEELEDAILTEVADPMAALATGNLDVVLVTPNDTRAMIEGDGSAEITLHYDRSEMRSRVARGRVQDLLDEKSKEIAAQRLAALGRAPEFVQPIQLQSQDAAPPKKATGMILGAILPMAMVLMIALGAYYPAVDLTAGEKERGTFETLLSTPISKLEIVSGKFLAVFGLALLTGLLNLASMAGTAAFLFTQLPEDMRQNLPVNVEIPLGALFALLLVVLPLAFFIAGAMMSVAVFARSFKEASNYVGPFMIVLLVLAVFAQVPGVELSATTQFVPVTNVVLLFKELLMGTAGAGDIFAVLLSTSIFALLSVLFAASIFQREEVVLADEKGVPLTLRRAQFRPRMTPTPMMAGGLFAVIMLLIFYVGATLQARSILPGLLITEWALIFAPVVLLFWFTRTNLREALLLHAPSPLQLFGAVIAALGAVLLAMQFGYWHNKVMPVPEELEASFAALFAAAPLPVLLFIVAVSPAICEEVLFRGALLSSLRGRMHPVLTVLLIGALFGIFHISIYRIAPTALLGVFLTYLALRTGSIVPAVAAHFVVNALGVLLGAGALPAWLASRIDVAQLEQEGVPISWLILGAVFICAGTLMIEGAARHTRRASA